MAVELRYCEECGDIIEGTEADRPGGGRFICAKCQGGGTEGARGNRAARPKDTGKSDGGAGGGASLELFSNDTIALHRQQLAGGGGSGGHDEPLRLLDDPVPGGGIGGGPLGGSGAMSGGGTPGGGDSPLHLVGGVPPGGGQGSSPGPAGGPGAAGSGGEMPDASSPSAGGSSSDAASEAARSASGRRMVFPCVHCRSQLAIRLVTRDSRLTCPYCGKHVYVTKNGKLLDRPPSVVRREGSGALQKIRPGSVALRGQGPAATEGSHEAGPRDPAGSWLDGQGGTGGGDTGAAAGGEATPAIVEGLPESGSGSGPGPAQPGSGDRSAPRSEASRGAPAAGRSKRGSSRRQRHREEDEPTSILKPAGGAGSTGHGDSGRRQAFEGFEDFEWAGGVQGAGGPGPEGAKEVGGTGRPPGTSSVSAWGQDLEALRAFGSATRDAQPKRDTGSGAGTGPAGQDRGSRTAEKPARRSTVRKRESKSGKTGRHGAVRGSRAAKRPSGPRHETSLLRRWTQRMRSIALVTLTVVGPFLVVSGVHHFVEGRAGGASRGSERAAQGSEGTFFDALGRIAERGIRGLLAGGMPEEPGRRRAR